MLRLRKVLGKVLEGFEQVTVIEKLIKSPETADKFLKCKFIQFHK